MSPLQLIEYLAIGFFAATGALVAANKRMDIFGFILLGTVTGMGGGTVRDVMLGNTPIFWVRDPTFVAVCAVASILTFFGAELPASRLRIMLWLDAVGLAVFSIVGAQKALEAGAGALVAIAMGVVTATFGGIIRDILSGESPLILRREIYVTAAFAGTMVYTLALTTLPSHIASSLGMIVVFLIRALAIQFHWSLPVYQARG